MEPLKFVALDPDDLEVVVDPSAGCRGQGRRRALAAAGEAPGARPRPLRLAGVECIEPRNAPPPLGAALRPRAALQVQAGQARRQGHGPQPSGRRVRADRYARRCRDADVLGRRRRCGSRSSAWRSNWSTSARPGRPTRVRPIRAGRARRPALKASSASISPFPDGCSMKGHADPSRCPIPRFRRTIPRLPRHQARGLG